MTGATVIRYLASGYGGPVFRLNRLPKWYSFRMVTSGVVKVEFRVTTCQPLLNSRC